MSSSYLATLEDLATKYAQLRDVIVSLSALAGVDASTYLRAGSPIEHVTGAPFVPVVHPPKTAPLKREKPPRPQRPASPSTNGTGRANKVVARQAAILEALRVWKGKPIAPSELAHELGWEPEKLRRNIEPLIEARQVIAEGVTATRRFSLPA